MSLVGPRPPLPGQLAEYDAKTVHRLDVTPGLTGLAQVSGGTRMTWPQRWLYDAWTMFGGVPLAWIYTS